MHACRQYDNADVKHPTSGEENERDTKRILVGEGIAMNGPANQDPQTAQRWRSRSVRLSG
jgi:hypothetical protein